mgnify:CR=1 FL=1
MNNNEIIVKNDKQIEMKNYQEAIVNPDFNNNFDMQPLLATAGTLEITEEQKKILSAPIDEKKIQIRPDGLVYLSWIEYQSRLDEAFGSAWSLVPQGMPKYDRNTNLILWGFYLIIKGKFVDFAIGQNEYIDTNRTMTYGDAIEGSKSNALMRCCKRLGIGLELWDRDYVEKWKEKYAYKKYDEIKKRYLWYKKSDLNEEQHKSDVKEAKKEDKKEEQQAYSIIKDVENLVDCEIEKKEKKGGGVYLSLKLKSPKMTLYCFDTKIIDKLLEIKGKFDIHYSTSEVSGRSFNNIIEIVQK